MDKFFLAIIGVIAIVAMVAIVGIVSQESSESAEPVPVYDENGTIVGYSQDENLVGDVSRRTVRDPTKGSGRR